MQHLAAPIDMEVRRLISEDNLPLSLETMFSYVRQPFGFLTDLSAIA